MFFSTKTLKPKAFFSICTKDPRKNDSLTHFTHSVKTFWYTIMGFKVFRVYRWSIISADSNFFQQSESVLAAYFRGRLNQSSTFYKIFLTCLPKIRFLRGFKRFCGKQNWHCGIDRTLSSSAKVFTLVKFQNSAKIQQRFIKTKCITFLHEIFISF